MNLAKQAAGNRAADWIESGMTVGLGTGSTVAYFIEALIKKQLNIQAVSSSEQSAALARQGGIRLLNINDVSQIDLTVDGADEIDSQKRMIKGGGGALLREKILAASSKEMIVIVDETKVVSTLGQAKLPVEITPYGSQTTQARLEKIGFASTWRRNEQGALFVTENHNLILDIHFSAPLPCPENEQEKIRNVPGVVDTGFFFSLAGRVVVGYGDGSTKTFC